MIYLEQLLLKKHDRPKKLPSEVDMGVKTGLLLCQDINVTEIQSTGNDIFISESIQIEVLGIDSSLGNSSG